MSLCGLLGLGQLPLAPPLGGLGAGFGVEDVVPPAEAAGVVADEALVVDVVVLGAGPEGQHVVQTPGELVAAVRVDGLEQAEDDPCVHGQDVQVLGDGAVQNGRADSSQSEDEDFDGRGVFSGHAEGRRVVVVDLVDVLVEVREDVHGAVRPVVPRVFEDEKDCNLVGHLQQRRERHTGLEAKELSHGVEEPNLGKFDGEVAEQDVESA